MLIFHLSLRAELVYAPPRAIIKASAFKKNFKDFSLNKKYKSIAFKIFSPTTT